VTKESVYTSIMDIEAIPEADLPLLVLSANNMSFLSWAIERRTSSHYAHLMWLHRPGFFATQDFYYRESPIKKYQGVRLKLWTCPHWKLEHKAQICYRIDEELKKPAWQTRYDFLAIFGQLFGKVHIETPWTNICSDWADLLKLSDTGYNLVHPSPGDVNNWLKTNPRYLCYGRYIPD